MPKNIELGVRLTADGRGFVGAITVSQKTVRKLRGETDKAAASTRGMAGAMRQAERSAQGAAGGFLAAHGRIAQYAAGALGIHQVARALAAVHTNSIRQEQALAQVEARMRSTGGAAGLTTDEVAALAAALQDATTFGDEAILEAQSVLLTFRGISRETFGSATEAVLDLATAMGQSAQSAAIQLGKALDDPNRGLDALTRSGLVLTDAQKRLIREFFAAGRAAEGQKIILDEVAVQMGGAARAARDTLGGALDALGNRIGDLTEVTRENTDGLVDWINEAEKALKLDPAQLSELHGDLLRIGEVLAYLTGGLLVKWTAGLLLAASGARKEALATRAQAMHKATLATKAAAANLRMRQGATAAGRLGAGMRVAGNAAMVLSRGLALVGGPVTLIATVGYAIYELTQRTREAGEALNEAAESSDEWAAALATLGGKKPPEMAKIALDIREGIREDQKALAAVRRDLRDVERGYALVEVNVPRRRRGRPRRQEDKMPLPEGIGSRVDLLAEEAELERRIESKEAAYDRVAAARRKALDLAGPTSGGEAQRQYDALGVAKDASDEYLKVAASLRTESERVADAYAAETAAIEANTKAGSKARADLTARATARRDEALAAIRQRKADQALANQRQSGLPALREAALRVAELSASRSLDARALADLTEKRRISAEVERSWPDAADGTKRALEALLALEAGLARQQELRLSLLDRYAPSLDRYAEQLRILGRLRAEGKLTDQQHDMAAGDVQNEIEAPQREQEILNAQGYHTRLEEAQREHARRMIEIKHGEIAGVANLLLAMEAAEHNFRNRSLVGNAQAAKSGLALVQTTFGQLGRLSKKAFRISQVAAVAQTLISTFEGAQDAYKWGAKFGGPPLGAVMAAAATAAGLAQVAAIKAQPPPQGFARGGVVDSPMWFTARGVPSGVAGEAGPEAILPLRRLPGGELGVRSAGAQAKVVTVAPRISIEMQVGGGAAGVELAGEEAAARVAEAVRSVIADEQRPGGLLNRTDVA